MSTKVIHLADEVHDMAKKHCTECGMRMSDWVASLIRKEITVLDKTPQVQLPISKIQQPVPLPVAVIQPSPRLVLEEKIRSIPQPRKRPVHTVPAEEQTSEAVVAAFSAPPFWAQRKSAS